MELLLGDNPFLGVSHLAQERAREELREASLARKAEVVVAALDAGATGFTFSAHESNLELLEYLGREYGVLGEMNYYILVPYAYGYVRKATVMGTAGLAAKLLKDLVGGGVVSAARALLGLDVERIAAVFIEREAKPFLQLLPRSRVKAILLHEVVTELIIAFGLERLYERIASHVEERIGVGFGVETRNVGLFQEWVRGRRVPGYVMTPLNPIGYQMAPGLREAEEAVERLSKGTRIIAMNVLASGAIGLEEALEYLEKWRGRIHGVAVGTSKPWRARENFSLLRRRLAGK